MTINRELALRTFSTSKRLLDELELMVMINLASENIDLALDRSVMDRLTAYLLPTAEKEVLNRILELITMATG